MKKKFVIPISIGCCVAVVAGSILGVSAYNKANTYVDVVSVANLSTTYYNDMNSSQGLVRSDVSQTIYPVENRQVEDIYVQEGDSVKIGDKLMAYDTTLLKLDLSDKEIDLERANRSIAKIESQLKQLRAGIVPDDSDIEVGSLPVDPITKIAGLSFSPLEHMVLTDGPSEYDETEEPKETDAPETEPETIPETVPETEPETIPETVPETEPGPQPETESQPETEPETESETEAPGKKPLKVLDWDTEIPDSKSPVLYVKSSTIIKPEFIYKIMGFDKKGETLDPKKAIKVTLYLKDKDEWYTLKGDKLELPDGEPDKTTVEQYIENKFQFNIKESNDIIDIDDFIDIDDVTYYTQEEINQMIKERESALSSLKHRVKQDLLDIKKMKSQLDDGVITSTVNGVVKTVNDPANSSSTDPIMVVDSTEGLYLVSTVNEYQLDEMQPGDSATITSWNTGSTFEAVITEISTYPTNNTDYYGSASISNYPVKAYIENTAGLSNYEYVQMTMDKATQDRSDHVFLEKSYVLNEEGTYYVYKRDDHDRLLKQEVEICGLLWGYYYEISDGLDESDYIAFPYGKNIKNGVKTKENHDLYF